MALLDGLLPGANPAIQGDRLDISYSACAALFAIADAAAGDREPMPLADVAATPSGPIAWADVTALLLPVDRDGHDLAAGLHGLVQAGWLDVTGQTAALTATGVEVLQALAEPRSVASLRVLEYAPPGGCTSARNFVAVATDQRVWLCGLTDGWDCDDSPGDPAISLLATDPDTVLKVARDLLDLSAST